MRKENSMSKGHDFNFDGGEILSSIGAAWFVSYAYYNHVDKKHVSWENSKFSKLSIQSRTSGYNRSKQYHIGWLHEVTQMQQLDMHQNKCGLNSTQIKKMATEILLKLLEEK
jgi:hypothetical protein